MRILLASTRSHRPSPHVERYLALVAGLVIIAVTCRIWIAIQEMVVDVAWFGGPDDAYLAQFRASSGWLWQHDPYGIALMAWGVIGILGLGPWTKMSWRTQTWPAAAWGITAVISCALYAILGCRLLLAPFGLLP